MNNLIGTHEVATLSYLDIKERKGQEQQMLLPAFYKTLLVYTFCIDQKVTKNLG
jgi:hypothetical protein